jgi:CheY-like chemotaxis protein
MRRILVVDDDPHVRLAICAWLQRCGFRVAVAAGGADGVDALRNSTFDLMIVDVFMPDMQGFESIRTFHAHAPAVPLVAISGYAFSGPAAESPHFVQMALRPGATRCLRKPFRPATLLGVIDECLSEVEPHRKYVAAPSAVTSAPSVPERQDVGGRRAGDRLSAQWKF